MINDYIGIGQEKDISIAINTATSKLTEPKLIIFFCDDQRFGEATEILHKKYPRTDVLGITGAGFNRKDWMQEFISVWGINSGIEATVGVIKSLDKYPIKYIKNVVDDMDRVHANQEDTLCMAFVTNSQEKLSTTLNAVLSKRGISLIGAAPYKDLSNPLGDKVSLNGEVYKNACVYAFIKNLNGKVKVYKENIYNRIGRQMVITKFNEQTGHIEELNGRPALTEYYSAIDEATNGTRKNIIMNSLSRIVGTEEYSLAVDIEKNKIKTYRALGCNDIVCATQLGDYKDIIKNTMNQIRKDFNNKVSTIFTVDCLYRYFALKDVNYINEYLDEINAISKHMGLISAGEQYNTQFINQSMVCAVFE